MSQRLLIADDHPMCATVLTLAVRAIDPGIEIDATSTLAEAEAAARAHHHDLILLDLMLPDVQGFAGLVLLRALRAGTPIAIVSSRDEPATIRQALLLGARGFLSKTATIDQMIVGVRVLLQGGQWFPDDAMTGAESGAVPVAGADRIGELSLGQLRVLRAVSSGHQNKQIAYDLGIAEPTVKSHLVTIFRKLGVTNRTQAVLALRSLEPVGDTPLVAV